MNFRLLGLRPGLIALSLVVVSVLAVCAADTGPGRTSSGRTASSAGSSVVGDRPGGPTTAAEWAAWVRQENHTPGDAGWRIGSTAGRTTGLEAYADRVSVRPGEPVGLYVSGSGPVRVRALRIGHYGGVTARTVWTGSLTASRQPVARVDEGAFPDAGGLRDTHVVVAAWHRSGTIDTTGWPEGAYLLRLDAGPASRYVPVTVRSASAKDRVLIVSAALTWQAYNQWGGGSLYEGEDEQFSSRSRAVSFDRPYDNGYGAGGFLTYDSPILTLAEKAGLPLAWATDYDLALDPGLIDGAAAVVFGGHAEYWTGPMHDAVTAAVDHGTNLAVFGANTAYWRVRLAGRTTSLAAQPDRRDGRPRVVVGTKNVALDPLAAADPGGATARFRDPPAPRPEETLTGMRYDCFPAETSWTVTDPQWWGYAGTGVRAGEKLTGVVGPESDRVFPVAGRPKPAQIVAYQPYACGPRAHTMHTGVYWVAESGAGVFAVGTMRWPCATQVGCTHVPGTRTAQVLSQVTVTVLTAFAQPRAGTVHPAQDTVGRYALPTRSTTPSA